MKPRAIRAGSAARGPPACRPDAEVLTGGSIFPPAGLNPHGLLSRLPRECPNFCVRGLVSLTHHWARDCKRRAIATARPRCARLFLGSIEMPVPSSRPAIVLAAAPGRVKSAVFGGTGATRSDRLGASMARTHDLPRPGAAAMLDPGRDGGAISHGRNQEGAAQPRCCPGRDRRSPEAPPLWHWRADFQVRPLTMRHTRPGPSS